MHSMINPYSPGHDNLARWVLLALLLNFIFIACSAAHAQPYQRAKVLDPAIGFAMTATERENIHYAYAGDPEKPGLLFIHGTPGDWGAFEMYLANKSLQQDYFMVSVDRLGWGRSPINDDDQAATAKHPSTGDFTVQARSIIAVMARYPQKKWLVVGHSLGASIAPKVAILDNQKVSGLLLLAGSLDPKLGRPRWYNRAASTLLVRWLLPSELRYSNDEIMALRRQLHVLQSDITSRQLSAVVVVMQGMKDKLVSPKNPKYVLENWKHHFAALRTIELPQAGHFLPWQQTDLVIETIRQFNIQ